MTPNRCSFAKCFSKTFLTSLPTRFRLSVITVTIIPTSRTVSYRWLFRPLPSPLPKDLSIALFMFSMGMFTLRASYVALRKGLVFMSPEPPFCTAIWIFFAILVKTALRLLSSTAFWCLMVDHFEWPDILPLYQMPISHWHPYHKIIYSLQHAKWINPWHQSRSY